jgi:hypothetical protein
MITNDTKGTREIKSSIVMANAASTRRRPFHQQNGLRFKEVNSKMSGPGSSVG